MGPVRIFCKHARECSMLYKITERREGGKLEHITSSRSFNELEILAEELECVHAWLDLRKAPTHDDQGNSYSTVGRMECLLEKKGTAVPDHKKVSLKDFDSLLGSLKYAREHLVYLLTEVEDGYYRRCETMELATHFYLGSPSGTIRHLRELPKDPVIGSWKEWLTEEALPPVESPALRETRGADLTGTSSEPYGQET